MPVHSVELGHLILLNVQVQDTGTSICKNSRLDDDTAFQHSNRANLPS